MKILLKLIKKLFHEIKKKTTLFYMKYLGKNGTNNYVHLLYVFTDKQLCSLTVCFHRKKNHQHIILLFLT